MNTPLLTACLALGLVACDRSRPPREPARTEAAPRVVPLVLSVLSPTPVEQAPVDPLALEHQDAPDVPVDHLANARALREEGDLVNALFEVRKALHDAPTDEEALLALTRVGPRAGEPRLSALAFARLGQLRPEDPFPLLQQARLLVALKQPAAAVGAAEEALLRDPENAETYQVLGRAHLEAGELLRAIKRLQQAVALAPEHGYALNNLGFAYLQNHEDARALEVLAQAAQLLPDVAYVHNNLGVALERAGRTDEARGAYQTAMDLAPRYARAQLNLARLGQLASADGRLPSGGQSAREPLPDLPAE